MTERDSFIETLTVDKPRKETAISGLLLLIVAGLTSLVVFVLLNLGLGLDWDPRQAPTAPIKWMLELSAVLLIVTYSILSFAASWLFRRALPFQFVRALGVFSFGWLLFVGGFRLLTGVGSALITQVVVLTIIVDLLLQVPRAFEARNLLLRMYQAGESKNHFDHEDWTWSGSLFSDVQTAFTSDYESGRSRILGRIHWLAPAFGIFIARYLGAPLVALGVGALLLTGSIVSFRRTLEEIGTIMFLRRLEASGKRPVILDWAIE